MAKSRPPQILLVGANTRLGVSIRALEESSVASGLVSSVIPKNDMTLNWMVASQVKTQLRAIRPDVVINCNDDFRLHSSPLTYDNRDDVWSRIVLAADNLARVCALYGIPFIHVSSCDVFGHPRVQGAVKTLDETARIDPLTHLGMSHVGAEHAILRLAQHRELDSRNFKHVIVRTGPLFGLSPGVPGRMSALNSLVGWAGSYAADANDAVVLASDVVASPTLADDLAKFLLWLCANMKSVNGGIYHFANSGYPSAADYGGVLSREIKGFRRIVAKKMLDPGSSYSVKTSTPLDCSKVKECFNYTVGDWVEAATMYGRACNKHV